MELLLALLAELLALLTVAGGILVALVLAAVIALGLLAVVGVRVATGRLRRWLRRGALAVVALALLALVLAQTVAFPALLRRALAEAAARGGPQITFEDAEVSLLRGVLRLRGAGLRRGDAVALRGERVVIDVDWPSLLLDERVRVEKLDLHGVSGRIHRSGGADGPRPRAGPPATVEHLTLADVDVAIAGDGAGAHHLTIKELSVAPLRSDHAIFDLLLASSGRLQIDAFHVEIRREAGRTTWTILGVPTELLGLELPPALRALEAVALDLEIVAEHDEPIADDAHLEITLGVAAARGPAGSDGAPARAIVGAASRIARAAGFGALSFDLTIDAAALRGETSLGASALRRVLHAALGEALNRRAGR